MQLLLHSTVSGSHINVRLKESHKYKVHNVTGYKYIVNTLPVQVGWYIRSYFT